MMKLLVIVALVLGMVAAKPTPTTCQVKLQNGDVYTIQDAVLPFMLPNNPNSPDYAALSLCHAMSPTVYQAEFGQEKWNNISVLQPAVFIYADPRPSFQIQQLGFSQWSQLSWSLGSSEFGPGPVIGTATSGSTELYISLSECVSSAAELDAEYNNAITRVGTTGTGFTITVTGAHVCTPCKSWLGPCGHPTLALNCDKTHIFEASKVTLPTSGLQTGKAAIITVAGSVRTQFSAGQKGTAVIKFTYAGTTASTRSFPLCAAFGNPHDCVITTGSNQFQLHLPNDWLPAYSPDGQYDVTITIAGEDGVKHGCVSFTAKIQ